VKRKRVSITPHAGRTATELALQLVVKEVDFTT